MADENAAEQGDGGRAKTAISQPHDKYFQRVFSNEQDAASVLRTCVPRPLADTLKWSTLSLVRGRFVDEDWRRRSGAGCRGSSTCWSTRPGWTRNQ